MVGSWLPDLLQYTCHIIFNYYYLGKAHLLPYGCLSRIRLLHTTIDTIIIIMTAISIANDIGPDNITMLMLLFEFVVIIVLLTSSFVPKDITIIL